MFTKAAELQFLSQVQWLGLALWVSKGETETSHFPGDFGYPGRAFHFLFALKTFSEGEAQAPNIYPQKYICLSNTKVSPAQKELMAIRAVEWSHTMGILDSLKENYWFFAFNLKYYKNKCIIVLNLLLSTTSSLLPPQGLSKKQAEQKREWNSTRGLLTDGNFMNNLTSWRDSNY